MKKLLIGFVGQGFVGKAYANDFEKRGFRVVRYALEEPYVRNKEKIRECDVVFIAVPTPTTPKGFDVSIVESALKLVGEGKIAIIKSTILPGTTNRLQKKFPKVFLFHSPEFLIATRAKDGVENPLRNIVGVPKLNKSSRQKALLVLKLLRPAPFAKIMAAKEAELVKYAGNCFLYTKVVYANMLFDLSKSLGIDFEMVREAFAADPRVGPSHTNPIGIDGRGAGGHCFIKDFAAFRAFYPASGDSNGQAILRALERKNNDLLLKSRKDLKILKAVYAQKGI